MAQTKNKYQIIQKVSEEDTLLLHPETEAEVVEYDNSSSGLNSTNVQDAIDELKNEAKVTGVKGNKESTYRTGQVNITPENIGAEVAGNVNTHNTSSTAHSDIRNLVSTAQSKADNAYSLALGRSKGVSYTSIQAFINEFNSLAKDSHNIGDSIYIQATGIPDFWIYSVETITSSYSYTTDDAFVKAIVNNGAVQVGYFKISVLESDKVDLSEYQTRVDESLTTTSKYIVGAINELKMSGDATKTTAVSNTLEITNIKDGTTKVGKAGTADSATSATSASKWTTARTIGVTVNGGTKANGSTTITGSGSESIDGSANKTISVTLGDSGVTAGTYSAVQVNAKGIVVAGGNMVEIGTAGQTEPSSNLATGGLFFKLT